MATASGSSTCSDSARRGVASPPAGHKGRVSSLTPSKPHHKSADHLPVQGKDKAGRGGREGGGGGGKERGRGGESRKGSMSPFKGSKPSGHKNKPEGKSPNFQDLIKLAAQNSGQLKGGDKAPTSALPKDRAPSKTRWMPSPAPPSRDPSPSLGRTLLDQNTKPRFRAHHKPLPPHKTTPPKQPGAGTTSGAAGRKRQDTTSVNGGNPTTALARRPLRKSGMVPLPM